MQTDAEIKATNANDQYLRQLSAGVKDEKIEARLPHMMKR